MPQKFEEVIVGDQRGFELRIGYYLQVKHDLWGFFPGIVTDSNEIILVFDADLVSRIWSIMPPKDSEVVKGLFFVNKQTDTAFSVSSGKLEELLSLETWHVLSRERFELITADEARPFGWAPGIFGAAIRGEEFERLRERALKKLVI
jgi:hypothetical protein